MQNNYLFLQRATPSEKGAFSRHFMSCIIRFFQQAAPA